MTAEKEARGLDIRMHLGILQRWRRVLLWGLLATTLIAYLVTFKPSFGFEWRSAAEYQSFARVMVTQPGFPVGRANLPVADPAVPLPQSGKEVFAPPERLSGLAELYAYLASSDPIRDLIRPKPLEDQISVVPALDSSGDSLPLLEVTTHGDSAENSKRTSEAVINGLREYLAINGEKSHVPPDERVDLVVLNPPEAGALIAGRSLALPVMVWLLGAALTLGVVYILQNLYPEGPAQLKGDWNILTPSPEPDAHLTNGSSDVDTQLAKHWAAVKRARRAERKT